MVFTFVDEIIDLVPGQTIRAKKWIRQDEEIFEVHYPGFPVVPGTFLTEMMAQTAGRCLDAEKKGRGLAMLAQIRSAQFRKYVGPSQLALIDGKILTNRDSYATAGCGIEVNGETVCTAEIMFTFVGLDKLSPAFQDDVLAAFLAKTTHSNE
jgi:3-hydroxyacyl-[acyl-carrier-protein] dehydratase